MSSEPKYSFKKCFNDQVLLMWTTQEHKTLLYKSSLLFSVIFHFLPVLADRTKYWRTDLITIILKQKLVHSIYKCRFLFHRHVLSRGSFTFMSVSLEMLCLPPMNSLVRPDIVIIKIINSNINYHQTRRKHQKEYQSRVGADAGNFQFFQLDKRLSQAFHL